MWNDPPCGHPTCRRPAAIVCTGLDMPSPTDGTGRGYGLTMALCHRHFWDWNARSLERRGRHGAARAIQELVDAGEFDTAPPLPGQERQAIPLRSFL